jgi:hypothetical protein
MTDEFNELDPNLQALIADARRPVAIDASARARLADALRAEPAPVRVSPLRAWMFEPRSFALPPITSVALAAGLVGIGVFTGLSINRDGRAPTEQPPAVAAVPQLPDSQARPRVVKFVLVAPQAARVAVVGDFNGWDGSATPAVRQADGSWVTLVTLRPGRHVYSFVVDGQFVSDPTAPIAPDDGFGHKNSVAVVTGASS